MSKSRHKLRWQADPVKTFYLGLGMGLTVALIIFVVAVIAG